jgi:hypothetical protein
VSSRFRGTTASRLKLLESEPQQVEGEYQSRWCPGALQAEDLTLLYAPSHDRR